MFTVDPAPTFTHTVKVTVPVDGGFKEETCRATYRVIPSTEIDELDLTGVGDSSDFLHKTVQKIDDVQDAQGNPIPWNDEVRAQLLAIPYLRRALARTYFEAIQGARVKN